MCEATCSKGCMAATVMIYFIMEDCYKASRLNTVCDKHWTNDF